MTSKKIEIDQEYGNLTIVGYSHKRKYYHYWYVLCGCGKASVVEASALRSGGTTSCGCSRNTHSFYNELLYRHYKHMIKRCEERSMCSSEFKDYPHFKNWSLNNGYKEGLHLCRNGDTGNYSPENTRWDTAEANAVEAHAQHYILLSPKGIEINVYNLVEFCRENGLSDPNLHKTFSGERKHHKGWKMIERCGKVKHKREVTEV